VDGTANFGRLVESRCLECHATRFQTAGLSENRYVKSSLVLGIGCEKCHGPGAEHVRRESSAHPPAPGSPEEAIVNPASLPLARQMDLCGLCHAGAGVPIEPTLSWQPGDNLAHYVEIGAPLPAAHADIDGRQVEELERSKCFASGKLSCITCHNVHQTQENPDSFSVHCLACHKVQSCGRFQAMGAAIRTKCVSCHMPKVRSAAFSSISDGAVVRAELRNHRIAIYPASATP
jgi:hypothetical protein